jgi:aromatic-amino-acid transaminase
MSGHFSSIPTESKDPIYGLNSAFYADARKEKVNLGMGVYCTETLTTPVMECVKLAEEALLKSETTKKYLPICGDKDYLEGAANLILGKELYDQFQDRFSLAQSIGGSGALRLGGDFLSRNIGTSIHISDPSWVNHKAIFSESGLKVLSYPYYDSETKDVNFSKLIEYLLTLSSKSVILFHVVCHNPSGADLTKEQWQEIAEICIEKELIPFFDAAYLGFDQTIEEDAYPIRLFLQKGIEFLLAVSFSKNLSLYAERVGFLLVFSELASTVAIDSQIKALTRRSYSSPPVHGAKIVLTILQIPSLMILWKKELADMKSRINRMKQLFEQSLSTTGKDYSYLLNKKGFFSYCHLSKKQVNILIKEYAIYLPSDGRVNLAGLNTESIPYVVNAFREIGE